MKRCRLALYITLKFRPLNLIIFYNSWLLIICQGIRKFVSVLRVLLEYYSIRSLFHSDNSLLYQVKYFLLLSLKTLDKFRLCFSFFFSFCSSLHSFKFKYFFILFSHYFFCKLFFIFIYSYYSFFLKVRFSLENNFISYLKNIKLCSKNPNHTRY